MKILQTIIVPQESVNDEFLSVVGIAFLNGDFVKKGDIVVEFETSKALVTIESEVDGYIYYFCSIGEDVPVNKPIIEIRDQKSINIGTELSSSEIKVISDVQNNLEEEIEKKYNTLFSKSAMVLMAKHNLEKSSFSKYDFVTEELILNYLSPKNKFEKIPLEGNYLEGKENKSLKQLVIASTDVSIEKLSFSKKREIEYLESVQNGGIISTIDISIDTKNIFQSVNSTLKYFKNSLLVLIVFETSLLLRKYNKLNAYFQNNNIIKYNFVNIGIAIDIEDGLKVVKIPETDKKTIRQIEEEIINLSNKYMSRTLETKDLTEITFTITDLSSFGVSSFIPLINKGNAAILGISENDEANRRSIVSLSFDHRITEGKYVSLFLRELKERIESYSFKENENNIIGIVCYKCLKSIEDDLNEVGFIKVINKRGQEKYICDSCFFNY